MIAKYSYEIHLKKLDEITDVLKKYQKIVDKKKFFSDQIMRDFILRNLQQACEALLDIGEMIIADFRLRKPEENNDITNILAENKVLSKSLQKKLYKIGGFRNILVHNYITLDLNKTYSHLIELIPVFKQFNKEISNFLLKK